MTMRIKGHGSWRGRFLFACLLAAGIPALAEGPPAAKETAAPPLVEAFLKGPVSLSAKVVRAAGKPEETSLPLFQVPVLDFQDQLELSFQGEAFDQRVTGADWSLVVVFLPKTVAPTDQGVVACRLKRKDDRMVVPVLTAPYDSVPMLFLIPDKNGRKKVLKDLNAHLGSFRTLCAKIAELSAERAAVDTFIEGLEKIDKTMSGPQYDNAVLGFLHAYGTGISVDAQAFLSTGSSNLDKCQFLTNEIQRTNVLVPETAGAETTVAQGTVVAGNRNASAYVSIFFDVATIISNLWPGHQFQYLPALARNLRGTSADLYYTDWIHTTGDTLGALMCCPGKWEEQEPPAFDLALDPAETLLKKETLLRAVPKDKTRSPLSLFGHDWKLLVTGPKGENLPPLALVPSPGKAAFVAAPAPLLEPLGRLGAAEVKARVVGRWGFTSLASGPLEIPVGCDPAWAPGKEELAGFQIGKACAFELPKAWAGLVEKVLFRPSAKGAAPLLARLTPREDGAREARFEPKPALAGPGALEILTHGATAPALTRPVTLLEAEPEAVALEARLHDAALVLQGRHLEGVQAVFFAERRFLPGPYDGAATTCKAEDGKPLEGVPGKAYPAALVTAAGRKALEPAVLLAPRPRLAEAQVLAMAVKGSGLPLAANQPVAPTGAPSQLSLIAAKGYRIPADGAFRAWLRNADDPAEARAVPSSRIRVMGNNQKATFTLVPAELLGGRASGRLEVQLQDDHCGASDWLPLPATFLDLPVIVAVQPSPEGTRLIGPSLEPIEAVAPAPEGPWEKVSLSIEEGHETVKLAAAPAGKCSLRVFGWPDLVLTLTFPPPPPKAEKPPVPAPPAANLKPGDGADDGTLEKPGRAPGTP